MLVKALQLYEDGLCSGCGQSAAHTFYNPKDAVPGPGMRNIRSFEPAQITCVACEMSEGIRKKEELGSGVKMYVKNLMEEQ